MTSGASAFASAAELFALERASLNGSVLIWTPDGWRLAVSAFDPFAGAPLADEDPVPTCDQGKRPLKPCGTYAAYKRHKRHGEEPCQPCRFAMRRYCADTERQRYAASSTFPSTRVDEAEPLLVTPTGSPLLVSVAGQGNPGSESPADDATPDRGKRDASCRRADEGLSA